MADSKMDGPPFTSLEDGKAAYVVQHEATHQEQDPPVNYCGNRYSSFRDPLLFHMDGLLKLGSKRPLQNEDLGKLRPEDSIEESYKRLSTSWAEELLLPKEQRSLPRALQRVVGWRVVLFGAFLQACANASDFAGPMILQALLQHLSPQGIKLSPAQLWFLTGLMLFAPCFATVCRQQAMLVFTRIGCSIRNSLIALTFRKALTLSPLARQKNSGTIDNIFSNDTENLQNFLTYLFPIMFSPAQIAVGLALVYSQVGPSTFVALAYLVSVMPMLVLCGMGFGIYIKKKMEESDKRIKLTKEVLGGVRVLKYNGWELPFIDKLEAIRRIELVHIQSIFNCWIGISFVMDSLPLVCPILIFYCYSALGNSLTYTTAFTTLTLFGIITQGASLLPGVFTHVGYAQNAASRIQNLLNEEERDSYVIRNELNPTAEGKSLPALTFINASFAWLLESQEDVGNAKEQGKDKNYEKVPDGPPPQDEAAAPKMEGQNRSNLTLNNISFSVPAGSLLAVVGGVGCGKSTLLSALLNDCYCLTGKGSVCVTGSVAYHAQEPWILNATIRDNILFGHALDEKKLASVLDMAALTVDLLTLPHGLDTEIGERGINLSGGQKARVSFARCLYKAADITLLDDPLSAVDAHTCDALFKQGIKSLTSAGKTVVLVTHQVHLLGECDLIAALNMDGTIKAFGTYESVIAQGIDLHQLIVPADEEKEEQFEVVNAIDGDAASTEAAHVDQDTRMRARSSSSAASRSRKPSIAAKGEEADKKKASAAQDKLMTEEDRKVGMVAKDVYIWFARAGGIILMCVVIFLCMASKSVNLAGVFVLATWGGKNEAAPLSQYENTAFLGQYALLLLAGLVISTLRTGLATVHGVRGGRVFHHMMIEKVLAAPVSFFDVTPVGRILNRFTGDLQLADQGLTAFIVIVITLLCEIVAGVIAISIATSGAFLPMLIPLMYAYSTIQSYYRKTNTEVRRLLAISRSPIFTEIQQTLSGVTSLEAFAQTGNFIKRLESKVDIFVGIQLMRAKTSIWLNMRIDSLGAIVSFFVVLLCVATTQAGTTLIPPASLAVALTYSFAIPVLFGAIFNMTAEIEGMMSGIERIKEYAENLPAEEDDKCRAASVIPPPEWPSEGHIQAVGITMRYRDGPLVLKGVDFDIAPQSKIGVAGRTGSGKSSLLVALFRIENLQSGVIYIDDVDISTIPLAILRKKLCIIPQTPYLFASSLRFNLDPFDEHSDLEVWEVLEAVGLTLAVKAMPGGLLSEVTDAGENLSVGQRQLLCFARALLRKAKIIVLDEVGRLVRLFYSILLLIRSLTLPHHFLPCPALPSPPLPCPALPFRPLPSPSLPFTTKATASIDNSSDKQIQEMLTSRLAEATVITIAHR